jgi:hypothetical protein
MVRATSASLVRQLQALTRMQRRPRQVTPPKKASPEALIAAIIWSVRRSWSASPAPGSGARKRSRPWLRVAAAISCAPGRAATPSTIAWAWAQVRSTSSATPSRPSSRKAA